MTLLLSLRKRAPSGLAEDGHPLRGGEETTMYDFLHTLFFSDHVPATEREIPPNTFLRLSSLTLQLRSARLVCFLPTLYNLVPFPPIQGPPYFSPNSPTPLLYTYRLFTAVSSPQFDAV